MLTYLLNMDIHVHGPYKMTRITHSTKIYCARVGGQSVLEFCQKDTNGTNLERYQQRKYWFYRCETYFGNCKNGMLQFRLFTNFNNLWNICFSTRHLNYNDKITENLNSLVAMASTSRHYTTHMYGYSNNKPHKQ